VSDIPQPGGSPFGPGFDLSQLFRMLRSEGPVNWDVARQVADWTAASPEPSAETIDPDAVTQLGELAHAAQTQVVSATGFADTFAAPIRAVTPREWARLHLDALRPVLEALAETLSRNGFGLGAGPEALADELDLGEDALPFGLGDMLDEEQLGELLRALAPALLGVQAGSMVGHLASHAFGGYDLPLPVVGAPRLLFVVANLDAFEADWSLSRDDFRFAVALHEVVHAAVRSVGWVRERLVDLATEYVSGYRIDPGAIEGALDMSAVDPSDPSTLSAAIGDPESLLGAMQTDEQRASLARLQAFASVLEGYADTVLDQVARPLIPSFDQINEAVRRHRLERGEAERFVERLLGLELRAEHYEAGEAFSRGVVERAGLAGLSRLWEDPSRVPTVPELEAPGLWLARIELPLDES